ncbi:MAG: efflux RND transporter permease subunit [Calditrichia bacterium]
MAANQLDYRSVADALEQTNTVDFVGRLNESHQLYLNVADNRYRNIAEIGEIRITDRSTPVLLRDIAEILPAAQETFIKTRSNFHDAVLVNVLAQPGVNSVDVMRQVETRMTESPPKFSQWC